MSAPASELSRVYRLTQVRQQPLTVNIVATADECAALASRFGLVAIERIDATLTLTAQGEDVLADGRLRAAVTQSCVATGDPLPVIVDEAVALRFEPEPADAAPAGSDDERADEIATTSADWDARDVVAYDGATFDVGEAIAQTLLLSLDPYPRGPDADARLREKGVLTEDQAGPFAALAEIRDKLGKG